MCCGSGGAACRCRCSRRSPSARGRSAARRRSAAAPSRLGRRLPAPRPRPRAGRSAGGGRNGAAARSSAHRGFRMQLSRRPDSARRARGHGRGRHRRRGLSALLREAPLILSLPPFVLPPRSYVTLLPCFLAFPKARRLLFPEWGLSKRRNQRNVNVVRFVHNKVEESEVARIVEHPMHRSFACRCGASNSACTLRHRPDAPPSGTPAARFALGCRFSP